MLDYVNLIRSGIGLAQKAEEKEKGMRGLDEFFWAFPDGSDSISNGWSIYYEIEKQRTDPSANVLKYWPILEENPQTKIVLIQWLTQRCSSPKRWELRPFVASKIKLQHPDRFQYYAIEYAIDKNRHVLESIRRQIESIRW